MNERTTDYSKGSLSLLGTIAMDTGVMIEAHIFALTGQVAELAGGLLPIASLGAIFYLTMGIAIHWSALRHLHQDFEANRVVLGLSSKLDRAVAASLHDRRCTKALV